MVLRPGPSKLSTPPQRAREKSPQTNNYAMIFRGDEIRLHSSDLYFLLSHLRIAVIFWSSHFKVNIFAKRRWLKPESIWAGPLSFT